MKIAIIGGGIIGAALARHLNRAGADVTVFDTGPGATQASFGWVNASFFLNEDHFRLRAEGLAAWRRLGGHVSWSGCLCWEETGEAFDAQRDQLVRLGYDLQEVGQGEFAALEPQISAPPRALRFMQEGIAPPAAANSALLDGVRRISGVRVLGIASRNDKVTGLQTAQGDMSVDRVVVAAGIGSPVILDTVGVALPMLSRPGLMLRTAAVPPVMRHILVTPGQEVRQDAGGHIWAPTAANHQSDDAAQITERPDLLADAALERLQRLLPQQQLAWDHVMLAQRPMPQDGLPVFGACGPEGMFVAVMHSGITLAAITAELLGPQILGTPLSNAQSALAAPYSIDRFQGDEDSTPARS